MNSPVKPPSASPRVAAGKTTVEQDSATGFSDLHPDIIESQILKRLDGVSLSSISCCSATLRHLSSRKSMWAEVCHSTWPSTTFPIVDTVISTFPDGGPCSFFANAFPPPTVTDPPPPQLTPEKLISAVDVRYQDRLIFTKVDETETASGWFQCSPFRIELLEPKDVIPTRVKQPEGDRCTAIINDMTLSWIMIDPIGRRAVNLSSQKPVTVQNHWLTGEIQVRFATILAVDRGHMQLGILVTCGFSEGGDLQVKEVNLEIEDMDGTHLNGKDSLVILQRTMGGKKGNGRNRVEEARMRYKRFVEMRRERRERKMRRDGALDIFCVAFWVSALLAFWRFGFYWLQLRIS